jgi:hypothetical protein
MIHRVNRGELWRAITDARDVLSTVEAQIGEPLIELERVQELARAYSVQCEYMNDPENADIITATYRKFDILVSYADNGPADELLFAHISTGEGERTQYISTIYADTITEIDTRCRAMIDAIHKTVNSRAKKGEAI